MYRSFRCINLLDVSTYKQAPDAWVVQTEECTHFATHIFSETVSIFAIAQTLATVNRS